jgi:poly(3-hydroxybutyrate) depolymerase
MLYQTYQAYEDSSRPLRMLSGAIVAALSKRPGIWGNEILSRISATYELLALAGLSHKPPKFGIDTIALNGELVEVEESVAYRTPFCSLLRFAKPSLAAKEAQPKVLVIAPMSGHFATLLRGTVRTLLADHEVYITDWHNPRDIALDHGRFGVEEFVAHVIRFIEVLGEGAHVVAVCQPTVAALAAVSLMADENHPAQPRSMTLMAGPIDTRINPTKVNDLAKSKPIEWFERTLIGTVPDRHEGARRRVYPGFVQLSAFMNMNLERHIKAFADLYAHRVKGNADKAEAIRTFYEEYFATMDLTAEFYLETVSTIFQKHALPLGEMNLLGRKVDPRAIRKTALLTVEGEKDDICAIGQTVAAQDLCSGLRPYRKTHHVQTGVGHYGVFSGKRWENEIYPIVRGVIHMSGS